jgi:hypothetical protein
MHPALMQRKIGDGEVAFVLNISKIADVIACDKREAFAQGSQRVPRMRDPLARNDDQLQ